MVPHPPNRSLAAVVSQAFPTARLRWSKPLHGGVSARAIAFAVELEDGKVQKFVLRRPGAATPEAAKACVEREFAVLKHCRAQNLPTPEPYFVAGDQGGIVLEYIRGQPEFDRARAQALLEPMAKALAAIHRSPLQGLPLAHRTALVERDLAELPAELDSSLDEAGLRATLTELWPWPQHNPDALLHGDYWPGNLLWERGELAAVLDWEEPDIGDPLADLAIARLDLLWAFGEPAMDAFTEHYRKHTAIDWSYLPHWDLWAALRPMSNLKHWVTVYAKAPINRPDITEDSMCRDHRRFVERSLVALGRSS